jgi:hypothetical protein
MASMMMQSWSMGNGINDDAKLASCKISSIDKGPTTLGFKVYLESFNCCSLKAKDLQE